MANIEVPEEIFEQLCHVVRTAHNFAQYYGETIVSMEEDSNDEEEFDDAALSEVALTYGPAVMESIGDLLESIILAQDDGEIDDQILHLVEDLRERHQEGDFYDGDV